MHAADVAEFGEPPHLAIPRVRHEWDSQTALFLQFWQPERNFVKKSGKWCGPCPVASRNRGIVIREEGQIVTTDNQSTETERLLARIQSGDKTALDALLAGHRDYLRRVVEIRMGDQLRRRVDTSDVVQETQLVAARRIENYLSHRQIPFRLWLRQTAIDQIANLRQHHLNTQKRSMKQEIHLSENSSIMLAQSFLRDRPSRIARRRELAQQIREAVHEMGENDREILLLRHFEELTNREIGRLLGLNLDAVRKRYGRAILRFREKLIEQGVSKSS